MINAQEIQGQWNTVRGKLKEKWGQLTNDDLQLVEGNVDQLIGRIQQRVGGDRKTIENFISNLTTEHSSIKQGADAVAEYAQNASQAVQEGYEQVSEQAIEGYRQAERFVRQHPRESFGTLFGVGVVAGVVFGLLMSSEHSSPSRFGSHW